MTEKADLTDLPFEPNSSWCYRFARYKAIPEILTLPEVAAGEPVRLVELSALMLNKYLTKEQQEMRFQRAKVPGEISVASTVKFYIPFVASETGQLTKLGKGLYRLPQPDDLDTQGVEAAAIDAGIDEELDEAATYDGWIYAFSFPALVKPDGPFPIKVGRTTSEVEARVADQCKGRAVFDKPVVLKKWAVKRVGPMESAVHNVLKARGRWRDAAPGREWFDTTTAEVDSIIAFVTA